MEIEAVPPAGAEPTEQFVHITRADLENTTLSPGTPQSSNLQNATNSSSISHTSPTIFGLAPNYTSNHQPSPPLNILYIKVKEAVGLTKRSALSTPSSFTRISIISSTTGDSLGNLANTQIVKKTLNPVWNKEFLFRCQFTTNQTHQHKLLFEVLDEKPLKAHCFGQIAIPLTPNLANGQQIQFSRDLLPKDPTKPKKQRGRLSVELQVKEVAVPNNVTSRNPSGESSTGSTNLAYSNTTPVNQPTPNQPTSNQPTSNQPTAAATTPGLDEPLPDGWDKRKTQSGRVYYINHSQKTTQWEHPVNGVKDQRNRSRSTTGTSPAPGTSKNSNTSQTDLNTTNQVSSLYARRGQTVARPQSESVMHGVNEPASVDTGTGDAVFPTEENPGRISGASTGESSGNIKTTPGLPNGWEARKQDKSGKTYYVDHINKKTCWDHPGAQQSKANEGLPDCWEMRTTPSGKRFFIDHKSKKTTWQDPRLNKAKPVNRKSETSEVNFLDSQQVLGPLPSGWERKVNEKDGREFFVDHNTRVTQWEDPRLSAAFQAGPVMEYRRDFQQKVTFFRHQLRKLHTGSGTPNRCELKVRRRNIFEDSMTGIMMRKDPQNLRAKLWIDFEGEKGLDYGGVAREWFYLLSKEMFNPYYGLFEYSANDQYTLQINPNSGTFQEDHLKCYRFIGRVAGMAVFHGKLLDAFFIRPFYKMMLEKEITIRDMEAVDPEYYNSLDYIRRNDPEPLALTFSVDDEILGTQNLIENGSEVDVTEENKADYIEKIIDWRFKSRITKQMESFMKGFTEIVSANQIQIFDAQEMELLMCGYPDVDIQDWKKNTLYKGDFNQNSPAIQWFWKAVLLMDSESRIRLLQFVTGTSRVPMNGFTELQGSNGPQKFTIECWGTKDKLPRAHTCFNRLDLPPYESFEQLSKKLKMAIESSEGFEGVD